VYHLTLTTGVNSLKVNLTRTDINRLLKINTYIERLRIKFDRSDNWLDIIKLSTAVGKPLPTFK